MNEKSDEVKAGFGSLASRITGWTSNFLVTAIILLAALVFGRQLTYWWATEPGDAAMIRGGMPSLQPRIDESTGQWLDFGDLSATLLRTTLTGEKNQALSRLRDSCRALAAEANLDRPPGRMEAKMLGNTRRLKPVEQQAGHWKMFELDGPLPMVAVVQDARRAAAEAPRVLSWGLAFPVEADTNQWTLLACSPSGNPERNEGLLELPHPPAGRQLMSLRKQDGVLICLGGETSPQSWMRFYDRWFSRQGWEMQTEWQASDVAWYGRYHKPDSTRVVDFQIVVGSNSLHGMITVSD